MVLSKKSLQRSLTLLLLLPLLSSCALWQNKKKSSVENSTDTSTRTAAADIIRDAVSPPPITVGDVGKGATITISAPPTSINLAAKVKGNEEGTHEESWITKSQVRLPIGIALALAGIGLLILVFAIRATIRAAKSTASGNALVTGADEAIAAGIRTVRSLASVSTDPVAIAHFKTIEADMESNRGKLRAKR